MKKVLFAILSAGLAFASCSNETEMQSLPNAGEEVMATIQVDMAPKTRATIDNDGAAAHVNRCILEVRTGDSMKVYRHVEVSVNPATLTATFQLPLVISQTYDFLFWADNATLDPVGPKFTDKYYNTQDLTAVKIMNETTGNLDEKDAFFKAAHGVLFTGNAVSTLTYTLTRPFAQVNIVTNDLKEIKAANDQTLASNELWPAKISVNYTTAFPTKFNVSTGVASETKVINRKAEAVYGCAEAKAYNTLNMDYIFVNEVEGEGTTPFTITKAEITSMNGKVITILENAANIPMKRNYRTNILGSFLTEPQDFEVTINPLWLGDNLNDELPGPISEPQGCEVSEEPDEDGNIVATYTPGSTVVVIPEGVTKFITNPENPEAEGGVYNMTIESLTIPSTLDTAGEDLVTGCKNLMSITYNVEGIDFQLFNSFLVFTGENGIKEGGTLELNFIGIPNNFRFVKYKNYVTYEVIDDSSLRILSQTSSAGKIHVNLPAGWIDAGLLYQFKGDGVTPVVVFEDGVQVYTEN